jgi:hypothetical protein
MPPKPVLPIRWNQKPGDLWSSAAGPFALKVEPKGDGRWGWQIFVDSSSNPSAAGVAASLGAAKTATEQFVKRSGRV